MESLAHSPTALSAPMIALLVVVGFAAGFFNTVAGAGSLLTLPALMLAGLPADAANATKRIGVLAQSFVGTVGFARAGVLDHKALLRLAPIGVAGGVLGAWLATRVPERILKWILLATLLEVAWMTATKKLSAAPPDTPPPPRWKAWTMFFLVGVYGGFAQAGVGLILLAVLARTMRMDLVKGNAIKVAIVGLQTLAAVAVFAGAGDIRWREGGILAVGMMAGAAFAVGFAIKKSAWLERVALVAVIVAVVAAGLRELL
jgi:uncharacterized membrane protein YfcA